MLIFTIRTYTYVVDFLNMQTLLYLFYIQGKAAEAKLSRSETLDKEIHDMMSQPEASAQ
jgi:hypothetical protein